MHINWIEDALIDLRKIIDHISYHSEANAKNFADEIINKVEDINLHPKVGRVVPEFKTEAIREIFVQKYRIIYRQLPKGVRILSIFHGSQRLNKKLDRWDS
jgi:toxin ParE1/3/4